MGAGFTGKHLFGAKRDLHRVADAKVAQTLSKQQIEFVRYGRTDAL